MEQGFGTLLAGRRRLAFGLAGAGLLFLMLALLQLTTSRGWGYDFQAYYLAALRLARGENMYQLWTLEGPFRPGPFGLYLYAPPLALLLEPLTLLTTDAAVVLWFVLRVALLALACAVMPVRTTIRLAVFGVAAFSQPVLVDLVLGNVSVLVTVCLAFTWRWLDRPVGSIAAAAAMSIRSTLGILLVWWALRRRWRALLWTLLAGGVIILLSLPFVGPQGYRDFLTVLGNLSDVTGVEKNLDLGSTILRLELGPQLEPLSPQLATGALFTGYVIAIGASLYSLRFDRELSFMVTTCATLLLVPLLWDHYLSSLLLPAAFLAQRGRPWGLVLPLVAWLPLPFMPFVAIGATLVPFLAERPPAGLSTGPGPDTLADGPGGHPAVPAIAPDYEASPSLVGPAVAEPGARSRHTSSPG